MLNNFKTLVENHYRKDIWSEQTRAADVLQQMCSVFQDMKEAGVKWRLSSLQLWQKAMSHSCMNPENRKAGYVDEAETLWNELQSLTKQFKLTINGRRKTVKKRK